MIKFSFGNRIPETAISKTTGTVPQRCDSVVSWKKKERPLLIGFPTIIQNCSTLGKIATPSIWFNNRKSFENYRCLLPV